MKERENENRFPKLVNLSPKIEFQGFTLAEPTKSPLGKIPGVFDKH